jgi:putative tricarboxylic transport membrane protein
VRFNDAVWGVLLLVFSGALFLHVQGFPKIPGQQVGPSALPGALAIGLAICGAILVARGLRARSQAAAGGAIAARWVELPEWFASRPQVLGFVVLIAINLFYLVAVQRLGFILTGVVYLTALMWVLRVRPLRALLVAAVMTLLIHYCFYKLLRVPLPWGVLQPIAW